MSAEEQLSLREKLEKGIYDIDNAPIIISVDNDLVEVNKVLPYPDEIEAFESKEANCVHTPKIKAQSYGDYEFKIQMVNKKHFENRAAFDEIICPMKFRKEYKNFEKLSLKEVLVEVFSVFFTCNLKYYLENQDEIKKDLNCEIDDLVKCKSDRYKKEELERELVFKHQLCDLFDKLESFDVPDDKGGYEIMVKDFHLLDSDLEYDSGTFQRGNYFYTVSKTAFH